MAPESKRIAPVVLLLSGCFVMAGAAFSLHWKSLILLILLVLVGIVYLRLRLMALVVSIVRFWPFFLFAIAVHVAATRLWPSGGIVQVDWASVFAPGAKLLTRTFVIVLSTVIISNSYDPQEYGRSIARLSAGPQRLRRRFAQLGMLVSLTLSFVPYLQREQARIAMAWRSRGHQAGETKLKQVVALRKMIFPLLVSAFRTADQVAMALQVRGYNSAILATDLNPPAATDRQWWILIPVAAVTVCAVAA